MKNMTLFDLLAAFGKTKFRPSSMAEIETFDDDQVAKFLKKMKSTKGTGLRYCPQRNMHGGTIIPPRMTYTRRLNAWSHTVDECLYGSAVLPEARMGGYYGCFFNRDEDDKADDGTYEYVMLLAKEDEERFNQLDENALVGWEWDSYNNWWYPVVKKDITEKRKPR